MKKYAIITSLLTIVAVPAYAAIDCATPPTCESLGYTDTVANCTGDYLVCPLETTKGKCISSAQIGQVSYFVQDPGSPWVPCDGSPFTKTNYPDLFEVLHTSVQTNATSLPKIDDISSVKAYIYAGSASKTTVPVAGNNCAVRSSYVFSDGSCSSDTTYSGGTILGPFVGSPTQSSIGYITIGGVSAVTSISTAFNACTARGETLATAAQIANIPLYNNGNTSLSPMSGFNTPLLSKTYWVNNSNNTTNGYYISFSAAYTYTTNTDKSGTMGRFYYCYKTLTYR